MLRGGLDQRFVIDVPTENLARYYNPAYRLRRRHRNPWFPRVHGLALNSAQAQSRVGVRLLLVAVRSFSTV